MVDDDPGVAVLHDDPVGAPRRQAPPARKAEEGARDDAAAPEPSQADPKEVTQAEVADALARSAPALAGPLPYPYQPLGVFVMLHACARTAKDFFAEEGLPEEPGWESNDVFRYRGSCCYVLAC